jgi:hypothetical protein
MQRLAEWQNGTSSFSSFLDYHDNAPICAWSDSDELCFIPHFSGEIR